MIKIGAAGILTTVFLGLFAWAGQEIVSLKEKTVQLEVRREATIEAISDLKADMKEIKSTVNDIKIMLNRRR